jgi:superfamily II DNA or RNA helicase
MFALCGKIEHIISKDEVKDKNIKAVVKPVRTNFSIPTSALRYDGVIEYSKLSTILSLDKERNDLILNILNKEKDKYCLVLSDRLDGLEYLHNKFGNGVFINGKMTSKKAKEERKQAIEDMRNKKEHVLFSTFALSKEGLDIKNLNVIILASPTKNDTVLIQSVGRIERKDEGKDTPIVYDLIDNDKYFEDAWKKRKTIYRKNRQYYNGGIVMLVFEKYVKKQDKGVIKKSIYKCDMCHKTISKDERILISSSNLGENNVKRKWDLCEHCVKILEKNVDFWYSRIKKN